MATKPTIIALEEHYMDPEAKKYITGRDRTGRPPSRPASTMSAQGGVPRDGRRRHRHPGVVARASSPAARREWRSAWRPAPTTGSPTRCAPTQPLRRLRDAAHRRSGGRPTNSSARSPLVFKGAMVHGLTGSLFLDDRRSGRFSSARRRLTYRSACTRRSASGGGRGLLQGVC